MKILLLGDIKKSIKETRTSIKNRYSELKDNERRTDNLIIRGFSIDPRTSIEQLNVQKQNMMDRNNKSIMVDLSLEESDIGRQLEAVENIVNMRCPEYDASNIF